MLPEGVHILAPRTEAEAGVSALKLVASGRGSLAFFLGDAAQRAALFGPNLRWPQVLLAMHGEEAIGFIAIKRRGVGPYSPGFAGFRRVFGTVGGLWRWIAFLCTEWRDRRIPFYIYGLKVVVRVRRQGIAGALLDEAMALARHEGLAQVELELSGHNLAARQLYASKGFELCEELELGVLGRFLSFSRVLKMHARL